MVNGKTSVNARIFAYLGVALFLTFGLLAFHGSGWKGSVQLHTIMEIVATLLAAMIGALALVRYYSKKDVIILFIGAGFLGTAFLDGYHAVVTSEFFRPFMPSDIPSLIPWSWVASRQFLSILMFFSWLVWYVDHRQISAYKIKERDVYLFTAVFTIASFLFFAFVSLPRAYYGEFFFQRPEEFVPALFFLLALCGYLYKGNWKQDNFEHWLVLSLIVGFLGQAVFMSHSAVLFDYEFDVAHSLKKVSYVCVLTGLLVSMYGIFKREQESTERIRESEELFSKAFHSSPALMTISEPETGKHFDVNEMWMDTLGYSREEAAHSSAIELGVWAKPEERENFIKKLLEDQSVKNLETTFRKKNGSEIEVLIAGEIVQIGQENRLLFVAHDISKQKEMDRMKGEFVSTVSHELRTPLTSIKGSLGLIKSGTVGEMPPQMESMLDIAYKNSDRLVLLINDILDMEKIEAGQMDYRMKRLDLVSTVRHAIQADSGFGEEYGVEIAISEVPANAYVEGDEIRLAQVLSNLISNAAKFSPVGGRVEVGIDKIGESYRVLVNDNGSGIPDDFKDKIFDKFSQSDSSDTRKSGGTGLGLSIAKAIIERHRGSIDYTSEVGKGTTFFFSLPEFDETEIELLRKPDVLRREYRILICEDEPDVAKLLDVILRQSGFKTAIAYDAAQAKAQLATEKFDAMTLDIALPDQNGISLIQELRSNADTQYLPILVVSAKASDSEIELNGEAFGIIDWLQKPIDEDILISRLRSALAISSDRKPLVLHVEDDSDICSIVSKLLDEMAEVVIAKDITSAKRHLKDNNFDLMLLDMVLPDGSGEELLSLLQRSDGTKTPVIIFSVKDVSQDIADEIQAALVKSQTTNELLLETIVKAIESDWAANLKRRKTNQ